MGMSGLIWPRLYRGINEKYSIIDEIEIISPIENFICSMQKWKNHVFKPDERLLLSQIETMFYLPNCSYSLELYNLHSAISALGLPTEFMVLLSNHDGIQEELDELARIFCISNPIKAHVSLYDVIGTTEKIDEIQLNSKKIEKLFCCLNGQPRIGRLFMLGLLHNKNLINGNLVSYNFANTAKNYERKDAIHQEINYDRIMIKTFPESSTNEHLMLSHEDNLLLNSGARNFLDKTWSNIDDDTDVPNGKESRWQPKFLQRALVYLVTETVGDYPHAFLTEKTIKGILIKRPMLIAGPRNSLALLHKLGFKTWENFWDEGYDDLPTYTQRARAVIKIIENLSNLSTNELINICNQMSSVLEYNFNHYRDNFCHRDLEIFLKSI